ncbi:MAG: hypothetical protein SH868_11720 [Bythopirellula sp.]|nr:hypothetical protein [Bythopirellula sp.]
MDKIRAFAKVIWEQRFWVLSVLGLIVAVVCWKMAAGNLDAQFGTRKSAIDGMFTAMQGLKSKPVHPNPTVIEKDQAEVTKQTEIVQAVWKDLYNKQKESVLKWPKELGEQFITYIEKLKFRDDINSSMRSVYQNYIGKRFDGLLEIVKAQKLAEGSAGGGFGGRGGGEFDGGRGGGAVDPALVEEDYLVQWPEQDRLRTKLSFREAKPSALQIWVTQEDLWVYETLLNVIARTNDARKATRPDNTAIRTILALEVGAGASQGMQTAGQILMPAGAGAGGEGGGGGEYGGRSEMGGGEYGGGYPGGEGGGEYGGRGGEYGGGLEAGGDPAAMDSALLASRYLDDLGAPIADGTVGAEYRQLPIRMDLVMDQRYIPRLLIECANSPLPIEVKQIRINPEKSMEGFGGQGSSSGMMGPGGVPLDPIFAQVQIKGSVFIYNEPTGDPAAAPAVDDGQMAATE